MELAGYAQGGAANSHNFGGFFQSFNDGPTTNYCLGIYTQADSSVFVNRGVEGIGSSDVGQWNQGGIFFSTGIGHPTSSTGNYGVYAITENNRSTNYGVIGMANSGSNPTSYCTGVYGNAQNARASSSHGVDGTASTHSKRNIGVGGYADQDNNLDSVNIGVYGYVAGADTNYGMWATAKGGYHGNGIVNYGIYAEAANASSANYAGFFEGNVTVTGNLNVTGSISKGSGTFKIDHPTDPENKYLVHSFVESPDMMNVYSGNITTDANGIATVTLPNYFNAINKDFRYQLTCIGVFAQAIVKEEISGNSFVVQTDKPNVKISWQVTAIRNDKYAQQNRIEPEQLKAENEQGKYLHPELYGKTKGERVYPTHNSNGQKMMEEKRRQAKESKDAITVTENETNNNNVTEEPKNRIDKKSSVKKENSSTNRKTSK
jgi:hypothetical protein